MDRVRPSRVTAAPPCARPLGWFPDFAQRDSPPRWHPEYRCRDVRTGRFRGQADLGFFGLRLQVQRIDLAYRCRSGLREIRRWQSDAVDSEPMRPAEPVLVIDFITARRWVRYVRRNAAAFVPRLARATLLGERTRVGRV